MLIATTTKDINRDGQVLPAGTKVAVRWAITALRWRISPLPGAPWPEGFVEAQGECCWVDADAVTDVREGGQEVPAGSAIVEQIQRIHDDADHILGKRGDEHSFLTVTKLAPDALDHTTRGWAEWDATESNLLLLQQAVSALEGGPGEQADRAELIRALEKVYVELGRYSRWRVSTLRLDIVRTALRNSGVVL